CPAVPQITFCFGIQGQLDSGQGEAIYVNVNNIHTEEGIDATACDDLGRLRQASLDHGDDPRLCRVVAHRAWTSRLSDLEWTHGLRQQDAMEAAFHAGGEALRRRPSWRVRRLRPALDRQ